MFKIEKRIRRLLAVCAASGVLIGCSSLAPKASILFDASVFHLGGEMVSSEASPSVAGTTATGSFIIDQVRVLALTPARVDLDKPSIVMSPGFGLGSEIYLTTVDGRKGWAYEFLSRGHKVYLVERSHTARTGFDVDLFNDVLDGLAEVEEMPRLIVWRDDTVWTRWGLGAEGGVPFSDGQFPVEFVDQLTAAFTAVPVKSGDLADQAIGNPEGLSLLLEKSGPAILLTHSASGQDGFSVARERPDLVKGIVTIEPVGCPTKMPPELSGIPVLSVFGDHLEVRPQIVGRRDECRLLARSITESGGYGKHIDLPEIGIVGNSHIMMSDRNSASLADMIADWIDEVIL